MNTYQHGGGVSVPSLPGVVWRRSLRSGSSGNCVELASIPRGVAVRDSKTTHGSALLFGRSAWGAFVEAIKHNQA